MHKNILWKGIYYNSLENCSVSAGKTGIRIRSTIVGSHENTPYTIEYSITTNRRWETRRVSVTAHLSNTTHRVVLHKDSGGRWIENGGPAPRYNGCTDIDISLTPFTNTLPINRLGLKENEEAIIDVIYIDLLNTDTRPVRQHYKRLTAREYLYANVPNDFESTVTVDESGLVVEYPGLFARALIRDVDAPL